MSRSGPDALVLGVGNVLWADEGFGVRCAEAFASEYDVPDTVTIMDGGTQGLALINDMAAAKRLLIFDAVDAGLPPGSLTVVRGDDVPRFVAAKKVSLHQTSMMEIIALAELMAGGPADKITLIGFQPVDMEDYGGGLTPEASAQVPKALFAAVQELTLWGLAPKRSLTAMVDIMPTGITRQTYEEGRPSAEEAYRYGDDRVIAQLSKSPESV
ncbi:MAG: HyaD/HybD family hydrogenase maturation endopeptidase [Sphingomonadales bacterium]